VARYVICGAILESPLSLPELLLARGVQAPTVLSLHPAELRQPPSSCFRDVKDPEGRPWFSFANYRSRYYLRFPGLAAFELSDGFSKIQFSSMTSTPPETIRHLALDLVIPLALSAKGNLVLHASAVRSSSGAVLFIGPSGNGKSTLAAGFSQAGIPVLADDAVLIEESQKKVFARPSYPSLRLWQDMADGLFGSEVSFPNVAHYTPKKRIPLPPERLTSTKGRVLVRKVYVLASPQEAKDFRIQIEPLSTHQACVEIIRHSYCLDPSDREALDNSFRRAARIAARIPFFHLSYPRHTRFLPRVRRAVLNDE
jgi:hypothetical protein